MTPWFAGVGLNGMALQNARVSDITINNIFISMTIRFGEGFPGLAHYNTESE